MAKRAWWVIAVVVAVVGCKKREDPIAQFRDKGAETKPVAGSAEPAPAPATPATAGSATPAAGSAAASSSAPVAAGSAAEGYRVGDAVYGKWTDGNWYPGKIGKINDDGTYRVNYNDGDVSPSLATNKVKPRKAPASSGKASSSASKSGAQPCPATHWTRCPDGNCYLLSDDPSHCGSCSNSCPMRLSVCRNGRCDCTGVEKDSNGGVCP